MRGDAGTNGAKSKSFKRIGLRDQIMEWATPILVMPVEDSRIDLHTNDVSTTLVCHSLIDHPVGLDSSIADAQAGWIIIVPRGRRIQLFLPDLGLAVPWLGGVMKLQYLFLPEYDDIS